MAFEIERKFLVKETSFITKLPKGKKIVQAYLALLPEKNVRVRIVNDTQAFITIKSKINKLKKYEFEYEIPIGDAFMLLDSLCYKPFIEKIRYDILIENSKWEVDVFSGKFEGLVIAEIELPEESSSFTKPYWVGQEVTDDPKYSNSEMVKRAMVQ